MKYKNVILKIHGKQVKQINKTEAKKLFNAGKSFFIMPCNMVFVNLWGYPYEANKNDAIHIGCNSQENAFDIMYNEFIYYNCNNETGKYPIFFVYV